MIAAALKYDHEWAALMPLKDWQAEVERRLHVSANTNRRFP
jgi:hypothetical protein